MVCVWQVIKIELNEWKWFLPFEAPDPQPELKEKRKVKKQAKQPAVKLQSQTADKVEAATLTIAKFTLSSGESVIGVIIPANKVELVQEFLGGLCPAC